MDYIRYIPEEMVSVGSESEPLDGFGTLDVDNLDQEGYYRKGLPDGTQQSGGYFPLRKPYDGYAGVVMRHPDALMITRAKIDDDTLEVLLFTIEPGGNVVSAILSDRMSPGDLSVERDYKTINEFLNWTNASIQHNLETGGNLIGEDLPA